MPKESPEDWNGQAECFGRTTQEPLLHTPPPFSAYPLSRQPDTIRIETPISNQSFVCYVPSPTSGMNRHGKLYFNCAKWCGNHSGISRGKIHMGNNRLYCNELQNFYILEQEIRLCRRPQEISKIINKSTHNRLNPDR